MAVAASVLVRDLRKRYGRIEAVRGISFDIAPGEIFGLIGPNGAGKTTTIECVIGLREPDAGTIEVCGIDARRRSDEVKQKIGAALQTTALQDKITPREALDLFGSFYRDRAPTSALLERFALSDKADASFDSLSGGQRQRLALALAFVNSPALVFLDEPTAGLDAHARRELRSEIARMKQDGYTVLLTTHDIADAEELCDRLAIVDHGEIIATGSPREIMGQSTAMPTVTLETSAPMDLAAIAALPDVKGAARVDAHGTRVRFRTADVSRTLRDLTTMIDAQGRSVVELHVQKATLEDVFVELTGTSLAGEPAPVAAGVAP